MPERNGNEVSASSDAASDGATPSEGTDRDGNRLRALSTGRRDYLRLTGVGLAALGGVGLGMNGAVDTAGAAPLDSNNWQLAFEDDFSGGSLDSSTWSPGYGWGRGSNNHDGKVKNANIGVDNGKLRLEATNPNDGPPYHVGAVHTLGNFEFGPGTYLEAKIEGIDLPGSLPAFWSKTAQGDGYYWPPEIDFFEVVNRADGSGGGESTHHIHYTESGEVNDPSTHGDYYNGDHKFNGHFANDWHTFGCAWREDSVTHYVNGQEVGTCSDSTVMRSLNNGAPFYMMLWLGVGHDWPGDPPGGDWSEYDATMSVEYIQAYDYAPDGGGGSDGDDDGTGGEHYLWARSADGNPFEFAFETSDGTIGIGSSGSASNYWVADDGTAAGGRSDKTGSLPGFQYDGEITSLLYRGSLELFVDDQPVDRSTVGTNAPNVVSIGGPDRQASYELDVTGALAKSTANGASVDPNDGISGSTATGGVNGGVDSYLFGGDVAAFSYSGSPRVLLNGEEVDPDALGSYEHTITFDGTDGQGPYELTVSGEIIKSDANGASINPNDELSGSTATGQVNGGKDSYEFNGDVQSISADSSITVILDGSEYEPGVRVEVTRVSESGAVDYIIESNGAFETLDGGDESTGSKAHGVVISGNDSYRLTGGEITDVSTFGGDVTVTVDGEQLG